DGELSDPGDDRLQRGHERQHDLAASLHLKLVGASLGSVAQPVKQLARGLATRVTVALEEGLQALLAQTAGIQRGGYRRRNASAIRESTDQNTFALRARNRRAGHGAGWPTPRACAPAHHAPGSSPEAPSS